MDRKIKIVVFEPNSSSMDRTCEMFLDLLDEKVEKYSIGKDRRVIELRKVTIKLYDVGQGKESYRGLKCDYMINNVNNSEFYNCIALSTLSSSKYLRSF